HGDDRRRQYRRLHPHHDHHHRPGNLQGKPAAGHGARPRPDFPDPADQRQRLGGTGVVRATGGLAMRAARSDLPLSFGDVSLTVGATTILDRLNLTIGPGAPTLILGPNGSGKTSLLRLCMGLASPSRGAVSWGGRTD